MNQTLLTLAIADRKDVVRARQRTRQIAALLGYDGLAQTYLAAGVFALACQVLRDRARISLLFRLYGGMLQIVPTSQAMWESNDERGSSNLRIEIPLPDSCPFSGPDVEWMVRELNQQTPPAIFEEITKLNQELLQALQELSVRRPTARPRSSPREAAA